MVYSLGSVSPERTPTGFNYVGPHAETRQGGMSTFYIEDGTTQTGIALNVVNVTQHTGLFNIGDAGAYGPYVPDAISLSGNIAVNGFFFEANLLIWDLRLV
ncbi:hypothetical protein HYN59_15170 [Flavobacterium album]|uniref:Uncharacterized protein n=1 Tax=Flavobacterium album TaxID=2175091 RepID=A0A2S1R1A6_9FLAO|nr:hypothetical protein [Flavobacterium album]AWH86366.1 hypothetical protein HYN59_15170 [Flavobacterium album]